MFEELPNHYFSDYISSNCSRWLAIGIIEVDRPGGQLVADTKTSN